MYRKRSIFSAVVAIVTILLIVGLMILTPFCQYQLEEGESGWVGLALIFIFIIGYPVLYATSIAFIITALVFAIKMLKSDDKDKLIHYNVSLLIASFALLPFFIFAIVFVGTFLFHSTLGVFPKIYVFALGIVYLIGIISRIISIVLLKKAPSED